MTATQRLKFFTRHYRAISSGFYASGPELTVGQKGPPRTCRFCSMPNPSFKTEAHAIPESLGNRQLILLEECDACNKYFSENLEDHFDKYTKPFRTLAQIRGKNKVPTYKSRDHGTRIELGHQIDITTRVDSAQVKIDEEAGKVTVNLDFEPYIPAAVYKALVKFALSTVDSNTELEAFKYTLEWVRDADHSRAMLNPLNLMITFVPGPRPTPGVFSTLLVKKPLRSDDIPYAIYVLAFGNLIFQIMIPSHLDGESDTTRTLSIPYFPTPFETGDWPYGLIGRATEDLSGLEPVRRTRTIDLNAKITRVS